MQRERGNDARARAPTGEAGGAGDRQSESKEAEGRAATETKKI